MKIVVRHELGEDGSHTTCVWSISDDGETQETAYLKEGEQVDLEVGLNPAWQAVTFGEVGPIPPPPGDDEAASAPSGEAPA